MKRREFVTLLGAGVGGWPRAARAHQAAMPGVAPINSGAPESGGRYAAAVRSALRLNPANVQGAESRLQGLPEAARALGLETEVLKASTSREIDAAFATLVRNRIDALLIAGDGFFTSRRSQFVMLSARDRIATSAVNRDLAEAGLLMSYGPNIAPMFHQVPVSTANILNGANPP